jgi:hypothetical protein
MQLPIAALKRSETALLDFLAEIPAGHPIEVLLDPLYWAHHARKLRLYGRIDAVAIDGAFDLTLRVVALGANWAKMRVLRTWIPEGGEEADPTPAEARFSVEHKGGGKWRVRTDTGHVIADNFPSKPEAVAAMQVHIQRMKTIQ